jgi:hypothetical protein
MSFSGRIAHFRALHMMARAGTLGPEERRAYDRSREELARTLLTSQRMNLRAGETPRRALRVLCALYVDLHLTGAWSRGSTIDLSSGGFAVMLTDTLPEGEPVGYQLYLPGQVIVRGIARVARARRDKVHVRASFAFDGLSDADIERIEMIVFDRVLLMYDDTPESR